MERQDGGGGGDNASEHLVCTRTTPTLYSTYTVAVRVSLHPACTHTSPTTRPGCRGSWRPCGLSFRGVGSRGVARRASSTHRASTRDTNVHRVQAVRLRCRRGLVPEVAEDVYVHGRGGAHQRGVHVGCRRVQIKVLLKDFSAAKVLLKVF